MKQMLHITKFVPYVTFITIGLRSDVVYLHPLWLPRPVAVGFGGGPVTTGEAPCGGRITNRYCYEEPSGKLIPSRLCGRTAARYVAGAICGPGPRAGAVQCAGLPVLWLVGSAGSPRSCTAAFATPFGAGSASAIRPCGPWSGQLVAESMTGNISSKNTINT